MIEASFYSDAELRTLGFKSIGQGCKISKKASIYGIEKISIGSNVRIDDYCVLSGNLQLGSFIHIAVGCLLFGGKDGILLEDYTGISSRVAIYGESDDYSGIWFTNPSVPEKYRHIIGGGVILRKHSIVGSGSTILPGVEIGEGVAVGSMSLVTKSLESWSICVGIPCKKIKNRKRDLIKLEKVLSNDV